MNILPKERQKRTQFILVIVVTVGVLAGIGFGLIRPQYAMLAKITREHKTKQAELQQDKTIIKKADETASDLADVSYKLMHAEDDLASGDIFAWTYDTIRKFKAPYKVELPTMDRPAMGEVDLVPQFPYKQLKVNVSGTAYYHDLGKFISDFENNFPHMRMVNLTIEPANLSGNGGEKLSFTMDIAALVKSGP